MLALRQFNEGWKDYGVFVTRRANEDKYNNAVAGLELTLFSIYQANEVRKKSKSA